MKKILLSLSTLALLALGACNNNEVVEPTTDNQETVQGRWLEQLRRLHQSKGVKLSTL